MQQIEKEKAMLVQLGVDKTLIEQNYNARRMELLNQYENSLVRSSFLKE